MKILDLPTNWDTVYQSGVCPDDLVDSGERNQTMACLHPCGGTITITVILVINQKDPHAGIGNNKVYMFTFHQHCYMPYKTAL